MSQAIETAPNFIRIDEWTATAGQPTPAQLADAAASSVRHVVNLAPDDVPGALVGEAGIVAELGMTFHQISVPWDAPDQTQFERFAAIMDKVADQSVLIHCQANYRVTAFYAAYAVRRLNWTDERARALIDQIWSSPSGFVMPPAWTAFLDRAMRG